MPFRPPLRFYSIPFENNGRRSLCVFFTLYKRVFVCVFVCAYASGSASASSYLRASNAGTSAACARLTSQIFGWIHKLASQNEIFLWENFSIYHRYFRVSFSSSVALSVSYRVNVCVCVSGWLVGRIVYEYIELTGRWNAVYSMQRNKAKHWKSTITQNNANKCTINSRKLWKEMQLYSNHTVDVLIYNDMQEIVSPKSTDRSCVSHFFVSKWIKMHRKLFCSIV